MKRITFANVGGSFFPTSSDPEPSRELTVALPAGVRDFCAQLRRILPAPAP